MIAQPRTEEEWSAASKRCGCYADLYESFVSLSCGSCDEFRGSPNGCGVICGATHEHSFGPKLTISKKMYEF